MQQLRSKPVHVCMLVLQHPFTDARIFKREAISLVKLGYKVTLVVPRNREGYMYDIDGTPFTDRFLEQEFVHESVRVVSYSPRMPHQAHMDKALRDGGYLYFDDPLFKVGLAQEADIYHAHEYHSLYSGVGIKRALMESKGKSVKLIYDSHEITEGDKVPIMKRMLPEVDTVITVSDAMSVWYNNTLPSLPVEVIYNSPPLSSSYVPAPAVKDTFIACYEGYMHKDKGSSAKLFEITKLCSEQFDFRFRILGGKAGPPMELPEAVKDRIDLCGWVNYNNIPEYMSDVDVGWIDYDIQASVTPLNYRIALPNKFFSYLNNGVPVVVNNCPEMARIIREYNCGIVIEHARPTAAQFAECFQQLRNDRKMLVTLSRNARKMMRDHFSWEHMEERLELLYADLVQQLDETLNLTCLPQEGGGLPIATANDPLVSIVIPTYNCPYIASSIESALAQSYPHTEVIVVNDGSTEHSDLIKPYFDRIRYIEKTNGGTGSALNEGIKQSRGQYFSWLSSDDLYSRDKVGKQLNFMLSANADASYTAFSFIDEHGQVTGRHGTPFASKSRFYEAMRGGNVINGCTVMLKRELFERIGLFDESLRCTQDYDLWCRIIPYYDFYYLDEPLVQYRLHHNMSTKKLNDTLTRERAMIRHKYHDMFERLIKQSSSDETRKPPNE